VRQFEVYANPLQVSRRFAPYVMVLQHHHVDLDSVVVAPLVTDKLATSIEIGVTFEGRELVLALTEMGSIPARPLRQPLGSLLDLDYQIHKAFDRLFKGF
jgi:hypothetical protein